MVFPLIALLLMGAPSLSQSFVNGSETAIAILQKEKSIPLDLNNDMGLKAKFPDAVKFYALQVEVTVGDGNRALTSETQGAVSASVVLNNCNKPEDIEEYAIKQVNLVKFSEISYNRVVIEVTELAYLNNEGKLITPAKRHFYTTSVNI